MYSSHSFLSLCLIIEERECSSMKCEQSNWFSWPMIVWFLEDKIKSHLKGEFDLKAVLHSMLSDQHKIWRVSDKKRTKTTTLWLTSTLFCWRSCLNTPLLFFIAQYTYKHKIFYLNIYWPPYRLEAHTHVAMNSARKTIIAKQINPHLEQLPDRISR